MINGYRWLAPLGFTAVLVGAMVFVVLVMWARRTKVTSPDPPVNVRLHTADGQTFALEFVFVGYTTDGLAEWDCVSRVPEGFLVKAITADEIPGGTSLHMPVGPDPHGQDFGEAFDGCG